MNTNALKIFAKEARNILLQSVTQRLHYWGFTEIGESTEEIDEVPGGYIFRGEVYNDDTIPAKFERLEQKIHDAQSFKDIREEAAYTWFNRLMAIKILESNGYNPTQLAYAPDTNTPKILQDAQRGVRRLDNSAQQNLLQTYLTNNQEEEAFALLLTDYCNQHPLLKTIFGKINDYTELLIPTNLLSSKGFVTFLNTSTAITAEDYQTVELIGWLYQFYISDRKDEVFANFKKRKKARPEDIPAATQIFTPKWIVQYMVENTLGKLYLDYETDAEDFKETLKYLVETDNNEEIEPLIEDISELRILDPACGSGHILVVAFEVLMNIYDEEGYDEKEAAQKILYQHLYGIDIDDRAAQLANFALHLKAAQYDRNLLRPTSQAEVAVYAMPEAIDFTADHLTFFLGEAGKPFTFEFENAFTALQQGKNIGSALVLTLSPDARTFLVNRLADLQTAYYQNQLSFIQKPLYLDILPFLKVLMTLTDRFPAVVANPPYMGRGNMNSDLKDYLDKYYSLSKSDMFAVFIEKMQQLSCKNGLVGNVTMESWMFLSSYEKLRKKLLKEITFTSLSHFGWHVMGIAFGTVSFIYKNNVNKNNLGIYNYLTIDDIDPILKRPSVFPLKKHRYAKINQSNFSKIPGNSIAYWVNKNGIAVFDKAKELKTIAELKRGMTTSNNALFLRFWAEVNQKKIGLNFLSREEAKKSLMKWFPYNKGGGYRKWFGNNEFLVNWFNDGDDVIAYAKTINKSYTRTIVNLSYYFKPSITWPYITSGRFGVRKLNSGFIYDSGGPSLFNSTYSNSYLTAFLNTKVCFFYLKVINPTINFQIVDIGKLPIIFNDDLIQNIEPFYFENINISKQDWDAHETSWDFKQSPLLTTEGTNLETSYQKWSIAVTTAFFQLHANEEELNRIFINLYGLQAELTPDVPLKDITILQSELDRKALANLAIEGLPRPLSGISLPIQKDEVIRQLVSYAIGCAMGRYRLGYNGLHIAHPNATDAEKAMYFYRNHEGINYDVAIDADGILPLMGSSSNFPDDAVSLVKELLTMIWGEDSLTHNLNFIQAALGEDLEAYLTHPNKFWKHHCRMYKKRPIYWFFASSPKSRPAFKVIAYLHRMDQYTIHKIRKNYLHPHQDYLHNHIEKLKANEANLNKIESRLLTQLEKDKLECRGYDELLKSLEAKQIALDLDNGVVENYKLFGKAVMKVK